MALIVLLAVLVVGLLAPAAAGAQEQQLEPTIIVDSATSSAAAPAVSATTLQAGQRYLLVVNGSYTETFPTTGGGTFTYFSDGVYCFDENPERPEFGCRARKQIFERSGLTVRLGSPGDGSPELMRPFYTKLSSAGPPPYVESHRYELSFTPASGGHLLMAIPRDPNSAYSGTLGVELWGQPVPGDGSTGPSGGTSPDLQDLLNSPDCGVSAATPIAAPARFQRLALPNQLGDDFCPQRLRARTWNRPARIPVLSPGGEATVSSPELAPAQRSATVTLGTSGGDIVVTLSDEDARYRRFSRAACLFVAANLAFNDLRSSGILEPNAVSSEDAGSFLQLSSLGKYLVACLRFVDDRLAATARPVALRVSSSPALRTRAAAAGCATRAVPIRLSASQATSRLRIRAQRAGAPPPTLRVTCLATPAGLRVTVRPRKAGVSLRNLVGPRLRVGLVRVPQSTRTAGPTITFRR
jgi:hypothetical protein